MFATAVVPLFGCFYCKKPSPRAALMAILCGAATRIILEFAIPKDGSLLLPYENPSFLDNGPAASTLYPSFIDVDPSLWWDPSTEPCDQQYFEDYTGVDSIAGFLCCLLVFLGIQTCEHYLGRPLFRFPGDEGYNKDTTEHPFKDSTVTTKRADNDVEDEEEADSA